MTEEEKKRAKIEFLKKVRFLTEDEVCALIDHIEDTGRFKPVKESVSEEELQEFNEGVDTLKEGVYSRWYAHLQEQYEKLKAEGKRGDLFYAIERILTDKECRPDGHSSESARIKAGEIIEEIETKGQAMVGGKVLKTITIPEGMRWDNSGYHIKTYNMSDEIKRIDRADFRFYISPTAENTPKIVEFLVGYSLDKKIPLHLKMRDDPCFPDKIIIYSDVENAEEVYKLICEVRNEHPEVFKGCKRMQGYGQLDDIVMFGEEPIKSISKLNSYSGVRGIAEKMVKRRNETLFNLSGIKNLLPNGDKLKREAAKSSILGLTYSKLQEECNKCNKTIGKNLSVGSFLGTKWCPRELSRFYSMEEMGGPLAKILIDLTLHDDSELRKMGYTDDEIRNALLCDAKKIGCVSDSVDEQALKNPTTRINITNHIIKKMLFGDGPVPTEMLDKIGEEIMIALHTSTNKDAIEFLKNFGNMSTSAGFQEALALQFICAITYDEMKRAKLNNFTFSLFGKSCILKDVGTNITKRLTGKEVPGYMTPQTQHEHAFYGVSTDYRYLPVNDDTKEMLDEAGYQIDKDGYIKPRIKETTK